MFLLNDRKRIRWACKEQQPRANDADSQPISKEIADEIILVELP
jgi:hypothetical protein